MEQNKLKTEVVFLNVCYCLLIIFIHGSSEMISSGDRSTFLFSLVLAMWRLSFFAISGFIFLSGYKIGFSKEITTYLPYIQGRFQKIFLPYVLWNVIYYVNFVIWGYFSFSASDLLYYIFSGTLSAPFYFVLVIMQFYLLMPIWQWMMRKVPPHIGISVAFVLQYTLKHLLAPVYVSILPNHTIFFDRFFSHFLVYWVLGLYCGKYRTVLLEKIQKYASILWGGTVIFATICLVLTYQSYLFEKANPYFLYFHDVYTWFVILTTLQVASKVKLRPWMMLVNQISYPIYLNHCFILLYLSRVLGYASFLGSSVLYFVQIIALIFLSILCNYILEKILAFYAQRMKKSYD
ncbi:MAG: acyltransferase [Eubacteriales bacterium]